MLNIKKKSSMEMIALFARYGVFVVFGILVIFFALSNDRFFTVTNMFLILQQASPLGIAVIGMVFVLIVVGIDISVGRSMFFIATVVGYLVTIAQVIPERSFDGAGGHLIVYLIVVVLGMVVGGINGFLVTKYRMLPFIVTLATGSILRGFALKISGSASINVAILGSLTNSSIGPIPYTLLLFIGFALIFDFVLRRTSYGRHLMAIGNSSTAAQKAGIRVNLNIIFAYVICATLGAIGGLLSAGQIGSVPAGFGEGNEFIVISAAVLGGTSLFGGKGNILPGAIIGIILITTIMNGLSMVDASPYIYTIVRGLIIFLAVMLDSVKYRGELR
jgi:ribose transport system permease protein